MFGNSFKDIYAINSHRKHDFIKMLQIITTTLSKMVTETTTR